MNASKTATLLRRGFSLPADDTNRITINQQPLTKDYLSPCSEKHFTYFLS